MYLCFLGLLCAQKASVSGLIINDQDQTPIHGANIYLEKLININQIDRFDLAILESLKQYIYVFKEKNI